MVKRLSREMTQLTPQTEARWTCWYHNFSLSTLVYLRVAAQEADKMRGAVVCVMVLLSAAALWAIPKEEFVVTARCVEN